MVHKSSLIPGISKFIDENVLAHYPVTSMKRILMAGAVSLYLKQNEAIVDTLTSSPLIAGLGVTKDNGMLDLEPIRDTLKNEINKAGFMRISIPMVGDIDFTTEDVDALYRFIVDANSQTSSNNSITTQQTSITGSGGIY